MSWRAKRIIDRRVLVDFDPYAPHHRRPCDEHMRGATHHYRQMCRNRPRRSDPGNRAQDEGHDGHGFKIGDHRIPCRICRNIGAAHGFYRGDGTARRVDKPDERKPQFMRHTLCLHGLFPDRGIRRFAPHGEIVGGDYHIAGIDPGTSEYEIVWGD